MNMNKIVSGIVLCCLHIVCVSQNLVINEVVGYNTVGYMNTAAKTPDWIELKTYRLKLYNYRNFQLPIENKKHSMAIARYTISTR